MRIFMIAAGTFKMNALFRPSAFLLPRTDRPKKECPAISAWADDFADQSALVDTQIMFSWHANVDLQMLIFITVILRKYCAVL
jgi:hypothetical protein